MRMIAIDAPKKKEAIPMPIWVFQFEDDVVPASAVMGVVKGFSLRRSMRLGRRFLVEIEDAFVDGRDLADGSSNWA